MSKNNDIKMVKLYNGVQVPSIGYGTWRVDDLSAPKLVKEAINLGYKHIDTASVYENENGVGKGIKESGVNRENLFVTSKVWNSDRGYDKTLRAFETSLKKLGLEYLDLYLIHWPCTPLVNDNYKAINIDTWKAMQRLYRDGLVRAIGVSNFLTHHIDVLMDAEYRPMVNQIEYHVGYTQKEIVDFCFNNGIAVEGWSPLGRGKILANPILNQLAIKYGKTPAQISVRWCLQNGIVPLPKTTTPSRMQENLSVFDFELSSEDVALLNNQNLGSSSGLHPDTFNR